MPVLVYDPDDPDQVAFVQEATRYYQVYDGRSGRSARAVAGARASRAALHASRGARFRRRIPAHFDVQTDQRRIRFSNSLVSPRSDETYLVQVGVPLDQRDAALRRFMSLLIWSLPAGLLAVLIVGRWMAGMGACASRRSRAATDGDDRRR